ncbi:MAG: flagellar filament capping protein FliD [Oscillospiraceae bacterium]|nr:flagellar filament capping protein FliD [Oscillospiraceae bacterium]
MINPMRNQPTRMMGLASGMDTDFIIQQTLRMHQFKIDNQMRNKKLIEWRQQTHNTIKDEISSLRTTFLSNLGSKSMMNRNVFNATKATVTGKNAGAVSVATTTGTPTGSIRIGQVASLARGASLSSSSSVSQNGGGFNPNSRLDSLFFLEGQRITFTNHQASVTNAAGEKVSINEAEYNAMESALNAADYKTTFTAADNGKEYEIIKKGDVLEIYEAGSDTMLHSFDLGALPGGTFEIGVDTYGVEKLGDGDFRLNGQKLNFYKEVTIGTGDDAVTYQRAEGSTTIGNNGRAVELVGETTLTINDVNITINSNDTIATMIDKVNKSNTGVTMSYNRLTDRFALETTGTGDSVEHDLRVSGTGNLLDLLSGSGAAIAADGQQARVFINNEWVTRDTNSFEYRGVRITLNETTAAGDEDTVVNFTRDATPAIDAIKGFIDSYNSIIRRLEGLLTERKSSSEVGYKPLTDEEKQGMTDKQIEEWESIARKGLLRNDNGIQNLVSSLRRTFFDQIEGAGLSPAQIGLTTGSYFDGTGGQIMINEERLREALEKDPDAVADVFIKIDTSTGTTRGVGLLHKIDGLMRDFVNTTQSTSIRNLEGSLKRANEQIQKLQERMFAEEDRLYKVFASMESSMQKLNQQGGWFNAMLGQG